MAALGVMDAVKAHGTRTGRRAVVAGVLAVLIAAAVAVWALGRQATPDARLDAQAKRFVTLALSLGRIDAAEVDAYFGPPDLAAKAQGPAPSPARLAEGLTALRADLARDEASSRRDRLAARVDHLIALVQARAAPHGRTFDEEARAIYGLEFAPPDPARLAAARARLEALLPGDGALSDRLAAYRARFVVPAEKRKAVFLRALAECRARTLARWPLPADEAVDVAWTGGGEAAWHRYLGGARSRLEVNPQAAAYIGPTLDLACHEAYPGHHAQFLMAEAAAGKGGLPLEDTVVLLRSPDQVLREGAAEFGVEIAFPPAARAAFLRDVLFPLAGFDPAQAATYDQIHRLAGEMAAAAAPILRDRHDGRSTRFDAAYALETEALIASPLALLDYEDRYGAYAASYAVAKDLVRQCVEARLGGRPGDRWRLLGDIVARTDLSALKGGACAA